MSKKNTIKLDMADTFRDNEIIPLITTYGRYFLYGLAALIVALIIIFRISSVKATNVEIDYITADKDFQEFEEAAFATGGDSKSFSDYLSDLTQIVNRHPDLQAKYDAKIAETLIIENQVSEAAPFANRSLERTKNDQLPYYNEFANTSVLISEGKHADALSKTLALQSNMDTNLSEQDLLKRGFSDQLYALNLIRISALYQVLNNKKDELTTLNKLSDFVKGKQNKVSSETKQFVDGFTEGKATLNQYIDLRKKTLTEKANS